MPALLKRRSRLLPTLWSWALGLLLLGAITVGGGRHLGAWLSVTDTVPSVAGGPKPVLVIEGWLNRDELLAAGVFARERGYLRVITSGGPIDDGFSPFPNFAERAAAELRPQLAGIALSAVPNPATKQDRTFASAVWVRDWMRQQGISAAAVDVYSRGPHARRTRMVYALAFGEGTQIGIVAGASRNVDWQQWWTTSEAAKAVVGEALSVSWTQCCFWPPPRGSHEERWAVSPRAP